MRKSSRRSGVGWRNVFLAGSFVGALGASGVGACVVVVDAGQEQCQTTGDCLGLGFAGTFCNDRKVCAPVAGYCSTNQECIRRSGGSESSVCRRSDDGQSNRCVNLLTPECPTIYADAGDLLNDDTVVVGSVWPPGLNPILLAAEQGFELARRDFKSANQGLPPKPNGKPRPIVISACQIPPSNLGSYKVAVDHLVDNVGVPVILGPLTAEWISYAVSRGEPAGTLVFTPDPQYLATVSSPSALFLTNGTPASAEVRMASLLVATQEERLRAALPEAERDRDLKVAFLQPGGGVTAELSRVMLENLRINGRGAAEQLDVNYDEFFYGDSTQALNPNSEFSRTMVEARAFAPDIVACLGAGCFPVVNDIENATGVRPYYVLAGEAAVPGLDLLMGNDESRRTRVLGYRAGRPASDPKGAAWTSRFERTFTESKSHPLATGTYDVFYLMAFGMGALGDKPITGNAVAEAIRTRFKEGGVKISTEPDFIKAAFNSLQAGQNIDVDGTLEPGVFSGSVLSKFYMTSWCLDANKARQPRQVDAGLTWSSDANALTGAVTCF